MDKRTLREKIIDATMNRTSSLGPGPGGCNQQFPSWGAPLNPAIVDYNDFNRLYGPYYALKEKKRIRKNRKLKLKKRYSIHHSNWRY